VALVARKKAIEKSMEEKRDSQKIDTYKIRTCAPSGIRFLVLRNNHSAKAPVDNFSELGRTYCDFKRQRLRVSYRSLLVTVLKPSGWNGPQSSGWDYSNVPYWASGRLDV
jgi:hypothetical protein